MNTSARMSGRGVRLVGSKTVSFHNVPVPSLFTHCKVNRYSTGTSIKKKTIIFFA